MSIRADEFTKEEFDTILQQLKDFRDVQDHLKEQVNKYFKEFDTDSDGCLDRKNLRKFLNAFFTQYKIHFPLTDEYVDAVFREIDANKDNKIQAEELEIYAMNFVKQLVTLYEQALSDK